MSKQPTSYTLKVTHGQFNHEIQVPSTATFGEVKKILVEDTFLQPWEQRLLFRGREVTDEETISDAGVKDRAKLMLLENMAAKEKEEEEMKRAEELRKATAALAEVHAEVDKYQMQIGNLRNVINEGGKVVVKELAIISELLMRQLLKLDGITAEGEAKQQRRAEVKRVQQLVEEVDLLKGGAPTPASVAGSLSPASASTSTSTSTSEVDSVQAAVMNALARRRQAISTEVEPLPSRPSLIIKTDWESLDLNESSRLAVRADSPSAVSVSRSSSKDEQQEQPKQSTAPQTARVRPPSPRTIAAARRGPDFPLQTGRQDFQSGNVLKRVGSMSPTSQSSPSSAIPPGLGNRSRRSLSLEDLNSSTYSPPVSPAGTVRSALRSSRSTSQIVSPSLADSISTFPPTALPKGAVGSPRGTGRKVRFAPSSPSGSTRTSPQPVAVGLSTFPSAAVSQLVTGTKARENGGDKAPPREELSTFPPTSVPYVQTENVVKTSSRPRTSRSSNSRRDSLDSQGRPIGGSEARAKSSPSAAEGGAAIAAKVADEQLVEGGKPTAAPLGRHSKGLGNVRQDTDLRTATLKLASANLGEENMGVSPSREARESVRVVRQFAGGVSPVGGETGSSRVAVGMSRAPSNKPQAVEVLDLISFRTEFQESAAAPNGGGAVVPFLPQAMPTIGDTHATNPNSFTSSQEADLGWWPSSSPTAHLMSTGPLPALENASSLTGFPAGLGGEGIALPASQDTSVESQSLEVMRFSDTNPFARSLPREGGFPGDTLSTRVSSAPAAPAPLWEKFD